MNCEGCRGLSHAYLRGECAPDEARDAAVHLAACADCAADVRETRAVLERLAALPQIEPRRPRSRAPAAAAAGLLAAAVLLGIFFGRPRPRPLPVAVETRQALSWDEPFHAAGFTTLALPGAGVLKLKPGTVLRCAGPREVLLESGEVFAEITRGFEIRAGDTVARVRGTRFGMAAPSTVYVLEGSVDVSSPRGNVRLGSDQVAVDARLVEVTAADRLRWLAPYERPSIRLTLDPQDRTTITPGAPLRWRFILETDALAPHTLADPGDPSQFLSLNIDGALASLDLSRAGGRARLDVAHPCVIVCPVDPALFREKGRAKVRAVFTSGANAPPPAWVGIVQSEPVDVEVR